MKRYRAARKRVQNSGFAIKRSPGKTYSYNRDINIRVLAYIRATARKLGGGSRAPLRIPASQFSATDIMNCACNKNTCIRKSVCPDECGGAVKLALRRNSGKKVKRRPRVSVAMRKEGREKKREKERAREEEKESKVRHE